VPFRFVIKAVFTILRRTTNPDGMLSKCSAAKVFEGILLTAKISFEISSA
jgi:hypothetical protein